MRIHSTLTHSILALTLAGAAAGLAPPAEAQTLTSVAGDPVAYRVSLPADWHSEQEDEVLYVMSEDEEFAIMVAAVDLVAVQEDPLPLPEAEARQLFTTMIMGSDSLLANLLYQMFLHQDEHPIENLTHELGTLGGERAAHLSGRMEMDGEEMWFRFHVTVKDGVMYMLGFLGQGDFDPEREPLMDRIHESFVLADAPPPLARRPSGKSGN